MGRWQRQLGQWRAKRLSLVVGSPLSSLVWFDSLIVSPWYHLIEPACARAAVNCRGHALSAPSTLLDLVSPVLAWCITVNAVDPAVHAPCKYV